MKYSIYAVLMLSAASPICAPLFASNMIEKEERVIETSEVYKLKGRVTDAKSGEVLPRAQITVLGTSIGLLSDEDGAFVINNLPRKRVTLRVRYTGYETKEIIVPEGSKDINVTLTPSHFNIEEVVVSANRTETRRHLAPVLVNSIYSLRFASLA